MQSIVMPLSNRPASSNPLGAATARPGTPATSPSKTAVPATLAFAPCATRTAADPPAANATLVK